MAETEPFLVGAFFFVVDGPLSFRAPGSVCVCLCVDVFFLFLPFAFDVKVVLTKERGARKGIVVVGESVGVW